jgi:GPH family glycoside/pentoside/hexuronide:cation symporter
MTSVTATTSFDVNHKPRKRLPVHILAALAAPTLPIAALSLPLVVYLPEFCTSTLKLDLSLVGTIFMIVRLLDIGFDPLIGGIMDRTNSKIGHYRPWLIAGAPMVMLGMGMLFMAQPGVGPVYITGWLLFAYAGWSIISLAQLALAANVSTDYNERSRIYGWWQAAFLIGMILSMFLPKIIAQFGYTTPSQSMSGMAWLVIILMPIMVTACLLFVHERPTSVKRDKSGLSQYFGLLKNKTVRQVLSAEALLGIATGCAGTVAIFFFTRVKHIERAEVGLIFVAIYVGALGATPLWSSLAGQIGKHRVLALAALGWALAQCMYFFVPAGSFALAALCAGATGISYGALNLLPRAMMADVSDLERLNSGVERTGLLFALLIGIWKVGQALSVGATFIALDRIGFSATPGADNPPQTLLGLSLLFIALPAALCICGGIAIYRYPLTAARHADVRRQLEARGEG